MTTTKRLFTKHQDPPAEFDDELLVYALSSVRHIRNHSPTKSHVRGDYKKHLKLLDGIALLLVMEDKSDVAAVAFLQTPTAIKFYFAKNRPCTETELAYIDSVIQMIKNYNGSESNEVALKIVEKAARGCTGKIRNRIGKIVKELKDSGLSAEMLQSDITNHGIWQKTEKLEGIIRQAVYNSFSIKDDSSPGAKRFNNKTDKELLTLYFGFVINHYVSVGELRNDLADLVDLMMLSYHIGWALDKDTIINNPALIQRIKKLGDYCSAALSITEALSNLVILSLKTQLTFDEVRPPPPAAYQMQNNFLRILNSYSSSQEPYQITWKELTSAYPLLGNKEEPPERDISVTTCVHCECTVANYMIQRIQEQNQVAGLKSVEIGISKYSCWFCERYFALLLSLSQIQVVVTGYHGKVPAGWRPPPDGDPRVLNGMVDLLRREVDEILAAAERKRRSDSNPIESGGDELGLKGREMTTEFGA